MGDFDTGRRWGRTAAALATVAVLTLLAGGAGLWAGRNSAATAGPVPASATPGVPVTPPWPATTPVATTPVAISTDPAGAADAGLGWGIPEPGAAGPFSVTDRGVPFGYRQDTDGAALAAVNAVIAGRYLAPTFTDPWAVLGFLADPQYADRGGNPALEDFFTGPVTPGIVGTTTPTTTTSPVTTPAASAAVAGAGERPAGGGRVIGVHAAPAATPAGAVQAVVLWQSFSREYRPDGRTGYTVRIEPVAVLLVWAGGDWKVSRVGPPPPGTAGGDVGTVVVGVVPDTFPVPAEGWHR